MDAVTYLCYATVAIKLHSENLRVTMKDSVIKLKVASLHSRNTEMLLQYLRRDFSFREMDIYRL